MLMHERLTKYTFIVHYINHLLTCWIIIIILVLSNIILILSLVLIISCHVLFELMVLYLLILFLVSAKAASSESDMISDFMWFLYKDLDRNRVINRSHLFTWRVLKMHAKTLCADVSFLLASPVWWSVEQQRSRARGKWCCDFCRTWSSWRSLLSSWGQFVCGCFGLWLVHICHWCTRVMLCLGALLLQLWLVTIVFCTCIGSVLVCDWYIYSVLLCRIVCHVALRWTCGADRMLRSNYLQTCLSCVWECTC